MTEKIETATISEMKLQKGKDIYPNVDLYSASIYYMLKIPVDLFSTDLIHASAKSSQWTNW